MKFNRGQEIVCVDDNWFLAGGHVEGFRFDNPKRGQIYIVDGYDSTGEFIYLNDPKCDQYYQEKAFEPLMTDEELEEMLLSVPELITL